MYIEETKALMDFIEKSPNCFYAVDNIKAILRENGFEELYETCDWQMKPGGKYYVIRNLSSVIAFKIPAADYKSFMICASHSDSPAFKVKPGAEIKVQGEYVKLNTEGYGGMIASSWFDRPLSAAGRLIVDTGDGLKTVLVNIDRDLFMIPSLAIHMNREVNKGYAYNLQKDLLPILGDGTSSGRFLTLLAENAGVEAGKIHGYDIFLYNRMKGCIWGAQQEYFSIGRIDDLQCAYASLQGFLAGENRNTIQVCAVLDNEEVGSGTKQGAKSTFLLDTLERISETMGRTPSQYKQTVAASFMVSADNGHALHPNYPEVADPTNQPFMNKGVVIKYNANQKYTTDAVSEAVFKKICEKVQVPYQTYTNKSDMAGGSTLGNLANEHVSMNTVDIGLAQLAMHASYETGGIKDTFFMIQAMKAFYEAYIEWGQGQTMKIIY